MTCGHLPELLYLAFTEEVQNTHNPYTSNILALQDGQILCLAHLYLIQNPTF